MPKHSGETILFKEILKFYIDKGDWTPNNELIDYCKTILGRTGDDSSQTKLAQFPAYFRFIEWQIPSLKTSLKRITDEGKLFYDALLKNNQDLVNLILLESMEKLTFGRGAHGVASDSDYEPPNIAVRIALSLDYFTKTEYQYILDQLVTYNKTIFDLITFVKKQRLKSQVSYPNINNAYVSDIKILQILSEFHFLELNNDKYTINKDLLNTYTDRLFDLRIINNLKDTPTATSENDYVISKNLIFYGAPGSGKSFKIDELMKINNVSPEYIFRVTFHPEFTYSDFIGQLLPKVINKPSGEKEITYDFSKGILTQSLEKAYEDTSKTIYLILEEMSRGDVAAIFGDIFQLLDRIQSGPEKGYSRYFVNNDLVAKEITAISDNKIKLPPNLCILGTVNTSDQNVFVMDTAFKRRFDWEYISTKPIEESPDEYFNNIKVEIIKNDSTKIEYEWVKFYMALNKFISHKDYLELGEDKQIGQFFIEFDLNASSDVIKNKLQNKLLQYLWSDIQKASFKRNISLFASSISSFSELYDKFGDDKCVFSNDFLSCLDTYTF